MSSSLKRKRGVSLLELTVAMVAASAIIGGAGAIYVTALASFKSAETSTRTANSRALLDEVLTRVSHQCFPADVVCQENLAERSRVVTYVYARELDPPRRRKKKVKTTSPDIWHYPYMVELPADPPTDRVPNPHRVTGLVYWYYGDDGGGGGSTDRVDNPGDTVLASAIYHLELDQEHWRTLASAGVLSTGLMTNGQYFTGMSVAEIENFVGLTVGGDNAQKRGRRLACSEIAKGVSHFDVRTGTGSAALAWAIEFGNLSL